MDILAQVAIQVPCVALLCFVFWQLGKLAITKWSDNDAKRTDAVAKGFADITSNLQDHGEQLARIDERLIANQPQAGEQTPAQGVPTRFKRR